MVGLAHLRRERGFGMIEVLVSLFILLTGLLGLAGLLARSQQAEMESYQRAQALVLLQDMVARINANRKD
ncbi:MAG: type IV pilus modification protein PilV, partial [Sulfuricella sp.]|nr:type IV pilus modification protein PilV [Sulfuricella sp.]